MFAGVMASFRLCLFFIHVLFRLHQCFDSWSFGALWSDGTLAALTELMQFSYTSSNTSKHHKPKVTLPVTFSSWPAVCWPRSTQGLFKWPVAVALCTCCPTIFTLPQQALACSATASASRKLAQASQRKLQSSFLCPEAYAQPGSDCIRGCNCMLPV